MPWSVDTPSVNGRKAERGVAKERGARLHSNSGAGPEKNDFSTDETVFEMKAVAKTHTVKGSDLTVLFEGAVRQGKEAVYIIDFGDAGLRLEGRVTKI
jgi:hypothetical protein